MSDFLKGYSQANERGLEPRGPDAQIGRYAAQTTLAPGHELFPIERKWKHGKVGSTNRLENVKQDDFRFQPACQRDGIGKRLLRFGRKIDRNQNGFDDDATVASIPSRRYSGCAAPRHGRSP